MEAPPIEILRTAFAQSVIATLATQVSCYLRLAMHPDVLFIDLIDALSRNAIIGDDAAGRLHRRLGMPGAGSPPVVQRAYWEQVLRERGIDLATPFHVPPAQPSAAPQETAPTH